MATINQVLVNDVLYDIEVNAENVVGEVDKATVTTKVGTADKGSATQPIYLKAGVPTVTTYKLEANVPSDAKFTDTVYTLPVATSSVLGGVKTGAGITNSSGTISVSYGTAAGTAC